MKKITFLFTAIFCFAFTWQMNAQHTFAPQGPVSVPGSTDVTLNFNNAANSAGVPAGIYTNFFVSVNWTDVNNAWSSEADLTISTSAGDVVIDPPTSGAADTGAATTLTFVGVLAGDYDPSVDGTFDLVLYQSWTASEAQWDNVTVTISGPPASPDCATTPFPADGATGISGGDLTFTWTAPASGPTPTSYNVYIYDDAIGTNPQLIVNVTTTSVDLINVPYDEVLFWAAVPVNQTTEATGCAIWSFTTASFPGYCLNFSYSSPYPSTTFTPTTCDGTTPNNITTIAYASEFSNVAVTAGQTYEFRSSLPDLITISYDGTVVETYGVTPVTWTATMDGIVRFYTHLDDDNCGEEGISRTRSVLCGASLGVDSFDAAALKVFPNPVKDVLNFSYTSEISSVAVYNMLGQVVLFKTVNANRESLNMSELNSGAYFVKVTINDATQTIRVIKQ